MQHFHFPHRIGHGLDRGAHLVGADAADAAHAECLDLGQLAGIEDEPLGLDPFVEVRELVARVTRGVEGDDDRGLDGSGQKAAQADGRHAVEQGLAVACIALVARRQTHFSYDAETIVDFSPTDERQFAGLTAYYSRYNFFYLTVTAHADGQREVLLMSSEISWPGGNLRFPAQPVQIPNEGRVRLALTIRGPKLQFFYAMEGDELQPIGCFRAAGPE